MPGPLIRFALEALFLVLVAIGAGFARLGVPAIVGVMAGAWLIVALIERAISLDASRRAAGLRAAEPPVEAAVPSLPSHVNVIHPLEPEPVAVGPPALGIPPQLAEAPPVPPPIAPRPSEPERADEEFALPPSVATPPSVAMPDPLTAPTPASWPVAAPLEASTPVAPEPPPPEPEPEPEPQPEPEPVPEPVAAAPPLQAVPALPAEPPPLPPAPAPPRTVVPFIPAGPRVWNLWELERLAREHGGLDAARDEERSFMLMYLREFAAADGSLPTDFDALVRETFGDLVGAPT